MRFEEKGTVDPCAMLLLVALDDAQNLSRDRKIID